MQVCSYAPTTRTRNLAPVENNDCFQELQPYILRPRPSLCTSVNLLLTIDRLKACCWLCSACMCTHVALLQHAPKIRNMQGLFLPFCFRAVMQGAPPALHQALHCACTEHKAHMSQHRCRLAPPSTTLSKHNTTSYQTCHRGTHGRLYTYTPPCRRLQQPYRALNQGDITLTP